jgi:lysophospholipase L1-like esterase
MKQKSSVTVLSALFAVVALLLPPAGSSADAPVGMVDEPCPEALPMPPAARELLSDLFIRPRILGPADFSRLASQPEFAAYDQELRRRAARDWPGLCRHRAANAALAPGAARIVFIGDSITENWLLADPAYFSGGIVNRGIGAQTSAQMLLRFRADVVALRPAAVHILAGTNDVAGNNGPVRSRDFQNNIESMVEIARASDIRVILGSIPPAASFFWQPALRPAPQIVALNNWLKDYAGRNRLDFIDYHSAMRGGNGELKPALGNDGVHPNRDGYALMRSLADAVIVGSRR